jgi:MoxR-like ATPase
MSRLQYGAHLDSARMAATLGHIFDTNLKRQEAGGTGVPVCIWGTHGLGKTETVKEFARRRGWKLAYCAPAQFEEMGDLHGLPTRMAADPERGESERTVFLPPDWVPTEEGPGILLLDDFNRADDRILRGLMQLLQEFEMFSWKLPPKWQIVCTANPEGADYSVTPMDDAMITRMLHMTMVFDAKAWAAWADQAGVDPRGIAFVLTYPELINDARTTPRTLTQFFEQIKDIPDLKDKLDLVQVLARASLDEVVASNFIAFVHGELDQLIEPAEILNAPDFSEVAKRIRVAATGKSGSTRMDVLSVLCTRLYLHLKRENYEPEPTHRENLVAFLLLPELPNDLRFSLHHDLVSLGRTISEMVKDRELANAIVGAM